MELELHPEIAISFNSRELGFSNLTTELELTITGWQSRTQPQSRDELLVAIRETLPEAKLKELLDALLQNDFLRTDGRIVKSVTEVGNTPHTQVHASCESAALVDALRDPAFLNQERLFLIHRQQEVLILPAGTTDSAGMEALRLFASGVQPLFLRSAYAFAALGSKQTVFGDRCEISVLQNLSSKYCGYDGDPIVVAVDGKVKSRWGKWPGRLHPVQRIVDSKIVLTDAVTLFRHGAEYACPDLRFADPDAGWWGWGHDTDETRSRSKSVAEAVERYAAGTIAYKKIIYSRSDRLALPVLDPRRIISYSDEQLRRHADWRNFDPTEERFWLLGENGHGQPTYILADLVFNPFIPPVKRNQRVHCRANSSGVAFGADAEGAKTRAWLECVERDAFLRVWYGRISQPRLRLELTSEFGRACLKSLKKASWKVALLLLPATIPVIAAVASKPDALLIGCAAGQIEPSIDKALSELSIAITGLPELQRLKPEDIQRAEDHTVLYRQDEMKEFGNFLLDSDETATEIEDLPVAAAYDPSEELYFVRLPAVTGPNEHVWRCIAPNLIPMTFGFDSEPQARPDVAELIASAVERGHNLFYRDDILFPHPFA